MGHLNEIVNRKVVGGTNSPTFRPLFNNTILFALFNYSKLRTLVSMVTSPTVFTVVKRMVPTMGPILHKYGFNCRI